jgi:hypothetical protein
VWGSLRLAPNTCVYGFGNIKVIMPQYYAEIGAIMLGYTRDTLKYRNILAPPHALPFAHEIRKSLTYLLQGYSQSIIFAEWIFKKCMGYLYSAIIFDSVRLDLPFVLHIQVTLVKHG